MAYGTAVRGLVIYLNEIHLTLTLTLKVLNPNPNPVLNPNPKSVTCLVGGMLKSPTLTLTLKVVPSVAECLNPTFYFWVQHSWWWGMLK